MDAEQLKDLQEQFRLSFLHGVNVAIDALPGAYLIVDGPYCVQTKAEMQYCHNLNCSFFSPDGRSRILHTATETRVEEVEGLSLNRTVTVEDLFRQVCAFDDLEVLFTTSFDFHQLLNFPLDQIADKIGKATGREVYAIPSRSLGGEWLDGYALTCETLARRIGLESGKGRADRIALVGYLWDRSEPDHVGNLKELGRICAALGLEVASVWLSGKGLSSLKAVESTGLILSLPYARDAARILGERLKIDVLDVDLPLGLSKTEELVNRLAEKTGKQGVAERFLEGELQAAVKATERHINRFIAGHPARVFLSDHHLAGALVPVCAELGLNLESDLDDPAPVCFAGTGGVVPEEWIHVPFGYPNYIEHPVSESPFLGFTGFRHLVDKVAGQILRRQTSEAMRKSRLVQGSQENE